MRVIFEQDNYRIVEHVDADYSLEDLKGDMFDHSYHPGFDAESLRDEERHFEELVSREGVYGYELERWNPAVSAGWEHINSCWGFVGQYSETDESFKHYIVDEMKQTIAEGE